MQILRLLQFKLEAGKGEAAAYVDSSVDLRQRRSSRSGHEPSHTNGRFIAGC
jgi:hypothetical protein